MRVLGVRLGGTWNGWTEAKDYEKATAFLKRDLKKTYKDEYARGEIDWLYVGPRWEV